MWVSALVEVCGVRDIWVFRRGISWMRMREWKMVKDLAKQRF